MNTSLTTSVPEEDEPVVTATVAATVVPEQLTNAQRKAVDHMTRLQRDTKPCIITMYWNGRGWQFWEGRPAGNVIG